MRHARGECSGTVLLLCLMWYALSAGSSVLNKLLLQEFPFPLTLTASSMITTSISSIPLSRRLGRVDGDAMRLQSRRLSLRTYFLAILPLAVGRLVAVFASFFSLYKIPVSFAHTVKATMPLFSVFCARVVVGEQQSGWVYLSLLPIVTGVVVASCSELSFSLIGLCSALFSTFTYALINSFVKKVLKDTGLHHVQLLGRIAQTSCLLIVPIWLMHDVYKYSQFEVKRSWPTLTAGVALSGLLNFFQNLCSFTLISRLSVVSYAVTNVTKRITVITVSLLTLKNPVTVANVFGMGMAIFGVLGYTKVNHTLRTQKTLPHTYHLDGSKPLVTIDEFPSDFNMATGGAYRKSTNRRNGTILPLNDAIIV